MEVRPLKKSNLRDLVFILLVLLILAAVVYGLLALNQGPSLQNYSEVHDLFRRQLVDTVLVNDNKLVLSLKEPYGPDNSYTVSYKLYSFELFYRDFNDIIVKQHNAGIIQSFNYPAGVQVPWWFDLVPWVVMIGIFIALWYAVFLRQNGGAGGGGGDRGAGRFGRVRARTVDENGKKVTFADVAGADEEKAELQEVVDFLKDPKRYLDLGARIPKGILLVGPPGTGKTLLARAVAGEAGVQFLSISGSDFVELYVGVGASRVRDLFEQAKKDSPAIVFIDEIDAVGRQRGAGLGGGHDEREQTLNQLLVEMDGFAANEGVVVMAATNRVDILDPALLRPGRFDRQVYVGQPDIKGREDILRIHARNKPLADDVDLREVARSTAGFTGADLENLMNEAALLAARKRGRFITMDDIRASVIKVIAGPEKKSRVVVERERRLTACHEAGHAIVIHALPSQDPVNQITIVPRGMAGGMTISMPQEDLSFQSKQYLTDRVAVCLGGRVAEQLVLGDVSTGAGNDLQRATAIARNMVMRYGMSDKLGSVVFDSGHDEVFIGRTMAHAKTYSEEVASQIDREVKAIVDRAYRRCEEILTAHRSELDLVADYLLEHETMDAETFEQVFSAPDALRSELESDGDADPEPPQPPARKAEKPTPPEDPKKAKE